MASSTDSDYRSTAMDQLSREVPESMLPPEASEDEKKAERLRLVHRGLDALQMIDERLNMIERAFGQVLPEVLGDLPLGEAVDLIAKLNNVVKNIAGDSGSASAVNKRLSFAKEVTMPALMDAAAVKTFNTDDFRVTRLSKLFASVNPEGGVYPDGHEFAGQPLAYGWLRENGYGSLIKPTVNASSLSAAAKEVIENGMEMPEELFKSHMKDSISITKKAKRS